jgi:hypothetical protein
MVDLTQYVAPVASSVQAAALVDLHAHLPEMHSAEAEQLTPHCPQATSLLLKLWQSVMLLPSVRLLGLYVQASGYSFGQTHFPAMHFCEPTHTTPQLLSGMLAAAAAAATTHSSNSTEQQLFHIT